MMIRDFSLESVPVIKLSFLLKLTRENPKVISFKLSMWCSENYLKTTFATIFPYRTYIFGNTANSK